MQGLAREAGLVPRVSLVSEKAGGGVSAGQDSSLGALVTRFPCSGSCKRTKKNEELVPYAVIALMGG